MHQSMAPVISRGIFQSVRFLCDVLKVKKTAGAGNPCGSYVLWQGRQDSNPQPLVLETSAVHTCNENQEFPKPLINKALCCHVAGEQLQRV